MVRFDFFHSAHGGIIDSEIPDLQLDYSDPVKTNIYVPNINPNKRFIFTIKSKSIIGTTTESGLDTNQIISHGLSNEFLQKFVEYLRFTIKNNIIEKVEIWDKKSRKQSKWLTFYGLDERGEMMNKKIPNIVFNYNTDGDFNTGIVRLDINENSIKPLSEWTPMAGLQDFNKKLSPIHEEQSSDEESDEELFEGPSDEEPPINQDGSMFSMISNNWFGRGGTNDTGYLHSRMAPFSLISCIYSMIPNEYYTNDEDVEITIYNSTCLYYPEDFDTTEKKGVLRLLNDYPEWSKLYIMSGDLLYELRESIQKINDKIEKLRNILYYINELMNYNTSIINDMLYKFLYDILLKEGKLKDKSFNETIMMVSQFIQDDSDYIFNELGPKITEILKSYSEEELIKHAEKYDIIDNDYKVYKDNGILYYKIVSQNMITLEDEINEYNINYSEFTDIMTEMYLSHFIDDARLEDMIHERYSELIDDLNKYKSRMTLIKELKMLDFTKTDNLGRRSKKSIRIKTGRSGSRMSRRRRSGVKN